MEDTLKMGKLAILPLTTLSLLTASCSLPVVNRSATDKAEVVSMSDHQMVSKLQYDELYRKYQELLKVSAKTEVPAKSEEKIEFKKEANVETVDLFSHVDPPEKEIHSEPSEPSVPPTTLAPAAQTAENPLAFGKIDQLIAEKNYESALKLLKDVESSNNKQTVVLAKSRLADILFLENEFDLALQVYEEIVKKYAFSGEVLHAVEQIAICAEKIKDLAKKEKYQSLSKEIFGAS